MLAGFGGLLMGVWLMIVVTPRHAPADLNWPVVSVAKKVGPSVVVVINNQKIGGRLQMKGMGSGVILNRNGDIVTNYHVVQGADALTVVLADGHRFRARIVGVDPPTDLAVIQIRAHDLVPITIARSSQVQPGQLVVAIGNSLGLTHTVTVGVISASDRVLYRDGWQYHLIQTDAAINPGNSGGPLVNAQGQLIGINSSKISQSGIEGIGFAIPSDTVQMVSTQLIRYGHVRRPWLGVRLQALPHRALGMLVVAVAAHSPAAQAGLKAGDLLTAIDGRPVRRLRDVVAVLEHEAVGQRVELKVLRGNAVLTMTVQLQELPQRDQKSFVS
ncbi:MAG: peptidase A2 [Sulfobacillus acidophilus]|uniref:Peptidase A2 n=1 Tax=Sulfobacillus acidophilus TaxID=53633 RepID=A0A2T2WLR1_9FIRM|nr:MAG: peptidase A2 [Sulfobacillus acidophilus]